MSKSDTANKKPKLLIVDDDPSILSQLGLALSEDFLVETADDTRSAWQAVERHRPDVITLDLAIEANDPETGFGLLERCLQFDPFMKVVMVTGNDDQRSALRAIRCGAADFFGKPVDVHELKVLLQRVLRTGQLERQNATLLKELGEEKRLGGLIGQSPAMRGVFQGIRKVAAADIAVLILGESGTGKELVAREIRRLSSRATKPFVSINCGAIPENLLESELFGHEKGSFTGAHASREGKLEMANTGIVLLDEIGELPLSLQVKLLRFLQEHEIERVGGRGVISLDVRVIAATNKDLEKEVQKGTFREDLYYRLSVVNITLPPLRERPEDTLFLASYFLDRFSNELDRGRMSFTAGARRAIEQYEWPGNVRQLEHHIHRAAVMSSGKMVEASDLELEEVDERKPISLKRARRESDRRTIQEALRRSHGNITQAAGLLGVSRPTLHDMLRKLKIESRNYKVQDAEA